MRVLVALLVVLAGCADVDQTQAPAPDPEEPIHQAVNVTIPQLLGNGTGGFRLEASGEGGTWIVAYHPFPVQETSAGYGYDLRLQTFGDHDSLWIPPSVTVMPEGGGYALEEWGPFSPFSEHYVLRGAALDEDVRGGVGIGHYLPLHGVFVAFGSSQEWSIELEVVWDDEGNVSSPSFITSGQDFRVVEGGSGTVPVAGGPADIVSFSFDAQAGWNHVELMDYRIQPNGVRDYDISFPTYQISGTGTQTGRWIPGLMGSAGSSGWLDYAGALFDENGTIEGEITYAQTSAFFQPVLAHMPLQQLPANMTGNGYWGSTWPFHPLPEVAPPPYYQVSYEEGVQAGPPARP